MVDVFFLDFVVIAATNQIIVIITEHFEFLEAK